MASGDSASMPYFPQPTLYVAAIVTQPTHNTMSAQEKDKSLFCGKCTKNIVTERFLVCTTRSEFVYTFYFTTPYAISFVYIYPSFHIQPTYLPYSTTYTIYATQKTITHARSIELTLLPAKLENKSISKAPQK